MLVTLATVVGPIVAQAGYRRPGVQLLGILLLIVLVLGIVYLVKRITK